MFVLIFLFLLFPFLRPFLLSTPRLGLGYSPPEIGDQLNLSDQRIPTHSSFSNSLTGRRNHGDDVWRLGGLAFMFSASILLQILACVLYNNWWPMLSALMYVLVPMPCLFFGDGSGNFLTRREGGVWIDCAKFLTGASTIGSIAIPIILCHAHLIEAGAMYIEFTSFFILVCTVVCYQQESREEEDWY